MHRAGSPTGPPPLSGPAAWLVGATFGIASALRGHRIFHPGGMAFRGRFRARRGAPLAGLTSARAVVRLSRGVGLPQPLPDVLGVAVKLPDLHGPGCDQDLLFASSIDAPLLHHLLVPARSFLGTTFSSGLFYRLDGRLVLLGLVPLARRPERADTDLGEVCTAQLRGPVGFTLAVAGEWERWRPIGDLELHALLPASEAERLEFDPWNTAPPLEPVGLLNRLRDAAYRGSQQGRRTP